MRIFVFSIGLASVLLHTAEAVRLQQVEAQSEEVLDEDFAQTETEAGGDDCDHQSMPTINIINNNRNMTGYAGCMGGMGGMMGGMGGPSQSASSPNG